MGKLFPHVFLHFEDSCRSHDTFSSTRVDLDHLQAVIFVAGLSRAGYWFACPEVMADAATVTVVVNQAKNSLISWDARELSKWQGKCTQTTRTLLLTSEKKEVCHLPEMTSKMGPLISFDPGLQEDGCCILLGIGIRAELSRSCRK